LLQESMIELITKEVLRQLNQIKSADSDQARPNVLALFTGGTIGLEPALTALTEIRNFPAEITVVLSAAAEKVIGVKRIQEYLGKSVVIVTSCDPYPGKLLRTADVITMPVMTQNTAAKLAGTISDTMLTTLILQGLLMGKPVIIAKNAANPKDNWRIRAGMGQASPGLSQAIEENLRKIERYGARVVDVRLLAVEISRNLGQTKNQPVADAKALAKILIDAAAIKTAYAAGEKTLHICPGTLITPLAVDAAREFAIELIWEQAGRY